MDNILLSRKRTTDGKTNRHFKIQEQKKKRYNKQAKQHCKYQCKLLGNVSIMLKCKLIHYLILTINYSR